MDLTFSIDGVGSKILVEVAKGRDPPLDLLRGNYEEYVEECRKLGSEAADWISYTRRFLELTGVEGEDSPERRSNALNVLANPSDEQIAAVTRLRGRLHLLRRRRNK
jgi:hypothetical protein